MAYTVKQLPLVWIPVSDGTQLAATIWLPSKKDNPPNSVATFPAILEYLPYRWSDCTAVRDDMRHSWFCSHGYVCVRVDLRGTGSSEGFYYDEYEKQEQDDCCDVIQWISEQPWCTGAVGMFGKSWGGFNGLQVASRQPPALKAVVSVYSTDDRYNGDFHHRGGCVVADILLSWGTFMLQRNAYPVHPRLVGKRWKELWLQRLENTSHPFTHKWLSHHVQDDYWRHGSVGEDYTLLRCPILLVGGWSDMYSETIFRMAEHHKGPLKLICGPWDHLYPDMSQMGPRIEFMRECLRWWDHHLKNVPNDIMEEPRLRLYMKEGHSAAAQVSEWPGRWIAEDSWPSPNTKKICFQPSISGKLEPKNVNIANEPQDVTNMKCFIKKGDVISVSMNALQGHTSPNGSFFGESLLPTDQRLENALSACWETEPFKEPIPLLGCAEVEMDLSCDRPEGMVVVRLCDVFPDRKATMISRGVLNLTHINGHCDEDIQGVIPGKMYHVEIKLETRAYVVPAGHSLLLAVSPSSWPMLWPSPAPTTLTVYPGQRCSLVLSVREESSAVKEKDLALKKFGPPDICPPPYAKKITQPKFSRTFTTDQLTGEHTFTMARDTGQEFIPKTGTTWGEKVTHVYTISDEKPNHPKVNVSGQTTVTVSPTEETSTNENLSPDLLCDVLLEYDTEMTSDEKYFHLFHHIRATEGGKICFEKSWTKDVERFFV